jgi:4-amino-4-deoxy-L-arabinose transferase-like glycosyltransferase
MTLTGTLYDFLVAATILLAGTGLGRLVLRPLRLDERGIFGLWLAAASGLGLLAVAVLLIGLVGLLNLVVWLPLLIGLAGIGLWAIVTSLRAHLPTMQPVPSWPERLMLGVLAVLGLGSLIWILLTHSLRPPTDWDAIAYHLALPKIYLEAGQIVYVPFNVTSNWPLNFEMLFTLALLLGSDIAAHLVMLASTALIALGLLIGGRRIFGDDRVGILAAAIFLLIPTVKRLGGVAMIDVGMGLFALGAAFSFERWQQTDRRNWLLLCGAFCGMAAGSKLMGGGIALIFGLLWIAVELRRRPFDLRATMLNGAALVLAGTALVAPWYLRSWFTTGNPIWPFGYDLLGGRNWDALGDEYHHQLLADAWTPDLPRNPIGLVVSFGYLLSDPERLGGYRGGLGLIIPLGAVLGLVLLRWAPRFVRQALAVSGAFWVLWFLLVSLQHRYLLPVAPLLALPAAWGVVFLADRLRQPVLRAAVLGALVIALLPQWPWYDASERALFAYRAPYLTGALSRDEVLDASIDIMPLLRYANDTLPADAYVLLLPFETRTYYLDRRYFWGSPVSQRVIRFEEHANAEDLLGTLRELGITHVIDSPTWIFTDLRYWEYDRALMLDLQARCGEPLLNHGPTVLYALTDCRAVAHQP